MVLYSIRKSDWEFVPFPEKIEKLNIDCVLNKFQMNLDTEQNKLSAK